MKKEIGLKVGSSYGFGDMDNLILKAISWGFNFFELSAANVKKISFYQKLKKKGIRFGIHVPHSFTLDSHPNLCATFSPYKENGKIWLAKTIKIAEAIGCEYIIFHPDRYKTPVIFAPNKEKAWQQLIKNIKNQRTKIPLLAEVMPDQTIFLNANAKESLTLKKALPKINFCFDVDHAFEAERDIDRIINWYQNINKKVKIFHLCDFDPKKRGHLVVGDGVIDFQKFLQKCPPRKDQRLILEVLPYSPKTSKKDLILSRKRLEKIIRA